MPRHRVGLHRGFFGFWPKKPGTILFGPSPAERVFEVFEDGYSVRELAPLGKPKRPRKSSRRKDHPANKKRAKTSRWVQAARLKRGSLHRQLGIPLGTKIPIKLLRSAAKKSGLLGKRARLALVFHKIRLNKKRRASGRLRV